MDKLISQHEELTKQMDDLAKQICAAPNPVENYLEPMTDCSMQFILKVKAHAIKCGADPSWKLVFRSYINYRCDYHLFNDVDFDIGPHSIRLHHNDDATSWDDIPVCKINDIEIIGYDGEWSCDISDKLTDEFLIKFFEDGIDFIQAPYYRPY